MDGSSGFKSYFGTKKTLFSKIGATFKVANSPVSYTLPYYDLPLVVPLFSVIVSTALPNYDGTENVILIS